MASTMHSKITEAPEIIFMIASNRVSHQTNTSHLGTRSVSLVARSESTRVRSSTNCARRFVLPMVRLNRGDSCRKNYVVHVTIVIGYQFDQLKSLVTHVPKGNLVMVISTFRDLDRELSALKRA